MLDLLNPFWATLLIAAIPYFVGIGLVIITYFTMKYLSKKKENIQYVKLALKVLKSIFGAKLGDKANEIFDIWLICLDKVQAGIW